MKRLFVFLLGAILFSSCVGGVTEFLKLSETQVNLGAEGGSFTVTSNINCYIDKITDNQGNVYTFEYYGTPSGTHRKTEWLDANGLSATYSDREISVSVSPSTEPREWTIRAFAGNNGACDLKVCQSEK